MDAVRFGKALGVGVKALKTAAEAAAAPNPRPLRPAASSQHSSVGNAGRTVARGVIQGRAAAVEVRQGSRRFGKAFWGPAARAGGVLWYEVTGTFFALFALAAGVEAWHRRLDFLGPPGPRQKAWFAVAMLAAFGWFTLSSFLRARRRASRP